MALSEVFAGSRLLLSSRSERRSTFNFLNCRMKFIYKAVFASALTVFAVSCATPKVAREEQTPLAPAPEAPRSVIAEQPKDRSEAYYQFMLGLLDERRGRYDEAIRRFEKAADKDETLVQAYERAAGLKLRMGDIAGAKRMAEKGLEITPDRVPLLVVLGGIESSFDDYEAAAATFERVVELEPERRDVWIYMAVAYLRSGRGELALKTLDRYNERFPDDVMGTYYKGRVQGHLGNWDEAEDIFKRLIKKHHGFARGYDGLAWVYKAQGKLEKAAKVYKSFLDEINPNDDEMKSKLAEIYLLMESYDEAVDQYESLVEGEPDDMDLHFRLGISHFRRAGITGKQEDYEKALAQFQLVRANDPQNKKVIYYIATIFEQLRLYDEAIEAWKGLLDSANDKARDICVKISELYERVGETEKSLEYAKQACEMDPNEPELYFFIGLLQNKLNRSEDAMESFKQAVRLRPEDEKYHFYLGVVYEKLKMYDECVEEMKKAIELNPKHTNALNYLGYIYADLGKNLDEAERLLKEALELEPDNGYFIDSLAWVYYRQGRYELALEHMLKAVRNIPPDPTVLEHLGDVYVALKDYPSAVDAYERSLKAEPDDDRVIDRDAVRKKLSEARKKFEKGGGI